MLTEWLLYDSRNDRMRQAVAKNQQEAIRKALDRGIVPQTTDQVRPRRAGADSNNQIMSPEEFEQILDQLRK